MKPTVVINKIVIDLECSYVVVYASFNSIQVIKKTHIYIFDFLQVYQLCYHTGLWKGPVCENIGHRESTF